MNRYLLKLAAKKEETRPHAIEATEKFDKNKGMILHWSTGSGKTKQFLEEAKKALDSDKKGRALIVAPASLVTNVDKELAKHNIKLDKKRLDVMSYEKAVNKADELRKNKYSIAIADEAQKLRNTNTKRTQTLSDILAGADKRLLATATANYNAPSDIAPLLNIAAGKKIVPEDPDVFNNRYLQQVAKKRTILQTILGKPKEFSTELKNKSELDKVFQKHVHYYDSMEDPKAQDKFPDLEERHIDVEMSPEQLMHYRYTEGELPFMLRMKVRRNLSLSAKERAQLNSFSSGVRQASNSYRHLLADENAAKYTPKIEKATKNLEEMMKTDKNFRGLVYSNYLKAGVDEYSRKLKEKGIKHSVYTGKLSAQEKDALVKDYNSGKTPVLLVSSSGAEGLDLKGTKLVQVIDPHWNPSKIKQVVGRARRYESHEHLPKEERKVVVEHYLSTHPKQFGKITPHSIDKYMSVNSDDKDQVFDKIRGAMKDATNQAGQA